MQTGRKFQIGMNEGSIEDFKVSEDVYYFAIVGGGYDSMIILNIFYISNVTILSGVQLGRSFL